MLVAWEFSGNLSGAEALLSFDIGPGANDLAIWYRQSGAWSQYSPAMLTYDTNGVASFTVNSLVSYAVTAAVPEPTTITLLLAALTAGACWRAWTQWRRRVLVNGTAAPILSRR